MRYEMEMIIAADELGNTAFMGMSVDVENAAKFIANKYKREDNAVLDTLKVLVRKRVSHLRKLETRMEEIFYSEKQDPDLDLGGIV